MSTRSQPPMTLTFTPTAPKSVPPVPVADAPTVCVLREEGSNGDREMVAAFALAGFNVSGGLEHYWGGGEEKKLGNEGEDGMEGEKGRGGKRRRTVKGRG